MVWFGEDEGLRHAVPREQVLDLPDHLRRVDPPRLEHQERLARVLVHHRQHPERASVIHRLITHEVPRAHVVPSRRAPHMHRVLRRPERSLPLPPAQHLEPVLAPQPMDETTLDVEALIAKTTVQHAVPRPQSLPDHPRHRLDDRLVPVDEHRRRCTTQRELWVPIPNARQRPTLTRRA
jgi:hypothetical protein